MIAVVGEEHRVVRRHVQAMRAREQPLTPGAQEIAFAVEHHHRMLAAIEHIDVVLLVDAHRADFVQRPSRRHLRPVVDLLVTVVAAADDDGHGFPPRRQAGRSSCG